MVEEEIDIEMVKLAERYADVLQDIKRLEKELNWSEDDIVLAERYESALENIEKLQKEWHPTDDIVEQAEKYVATLNEIKESDAVVE